MTQVTVFSDFACPASYLTEAALWSLDDRELEIHFHAFELHPQGGGAGTADFGDQVWTALQRLAAAVKVEIQPRRSTPRTGKAHEAARVARERGLEIELRGEIYAALWASDRDIGRIDVLAGLAEGIGIDAEDMRIALDIGSFEPAIEADNDLGRRLNIPGTPVIFIGTGSTARIVAGAQSRDGLLRAIEDWMNADRPAIDGV